MVKNVTQTFNTDLCIIIHPLSMPIIGMRLIFALGLVSWIIPTATTNNYFTFEYFICLCSSNSKYSLFITLNNSYKNESCILLEL